MIDLPTNMRENMSTVLEMYFYDTAIDRKITWMSYLSSLKVTSAVLTPANVVAEITAMLVSMLGTTLIPRFTFRTGAGGTNVIGIRIAAHTRPQSEMYERIYSRSGAREGHTQGYNYFPKQTSKNFMFVQDYGVVRSFYTAYKLL